MRWAGSPRSHSRPELKHNGTEISASFGDFDNDGFLDLYIVRENGDLLYRNSGSGTFEDVTERAKIVSAGEGNMALFFDADHDGDLDLFEAKTGPDMLFRNNSDGTFLEQAGKMGLTGGDATTFDAAFADFDVDADIDLVTVNENSGITLFSNQRQGIYKEITEESGLKAGGSPGSVAVGDYDNDGFPDLFAPSSKGAVTGLFRNKNNGTFEQAENTAEMFSLLKNVKVYDASFLDFDNDGFLDIIVAGEPVLNGGKGLFLFHNEGKGKIY